MRRRGNAAWTLAELMVVICLIGILSSFSMVNFQRAYEQTRVDLAAARLQDIWTAQRLYWLRHRQFADQLPTLLAEGLVDPGLKRALLESCARCPFVFEVVEADQDSFLARAHRTNSGVWSGDLSIDQDGTLRGGTSQRGREEIIRP